MIGILVGASEDLFVMGTWLGTLLVYGKADEPQAAWGNVEEIFYRRSVHPFSDVKGAYTSTMASGLGDFGQPHHAKDITAFVLYLASQSPDCSLVLTLYQTRNPNDTLITALTYTITSPKTLNLVPIFFRDHFFKFQIAISGINNPCRISGVTFDADLIGSTSHERRP